MRLLHSAFGSAGAAKLMSVEVGFRHGIYFVGFRQGCATCRAAGFGERLRCLSSREGGVDPAALAE